MINKRIILDVGANDGRDTVNLLQDTDAVVYAFEPTPHLLSNYLFPLKENYPDRLFIIPCAVSNYNGFAEFNIAGQADWGCSSLHTFSKDLQNTWPGRTDFRTTEKIIVPVMRIDTFITNLNISKIDFLHCDTQGNDLKVLQSFGEKISILESGEVEVFKQNPLYENITNSYEEVLLFLSNKGFRITNEYSNDIHGNEWNLSFKRN